MQFFQRRNIHILYLFVGVFFLLHSSGVSAQLTSSNYQVFGAQVSPVGGSGTSNSFSVTDGSGLGGRSTSNSFIARQGAPVGTALVAQSSGGSGGGEQNSSGGATVVSSPQAVQGIERLEVLVASRQSVLVRFRTAEVAVTSIRYSPRDSGIEFTTPSEKSFFRDHEFLITDIQPNTPYDFSVTLRSLSGGESSAGTYAFIISINDEQNQVIPNVRNARVEIGETYVVVRWDAPLTGTYRFVVTKSTTGIPALPEDGSRVFEGPEIRWQDTNVIRGQRYTYAIYAVDGAGRRSSGAVVSAFLPLPGQQQPSKPVARPPIQPVPSTATSTLPLPVIPAEPPPLPDTVRPLPDGQSIGDKPTVLRSIKLFSIVKQNVSNQYLDFERKVQSLSQQVLETLRRKIVGITDEFGRIRQDVIVNLSERQKQEFEEITKVPVPSAYDTKSVVKELTVQVPIDTDIADWHVVAGTQAILSVPGEVFEKPVKMIIATIQTSAYVLEYNSAQNSFEAAIDIPDAKGTYEMILQVIYTDNSFDEIKRTVLVDPYGMVYTKQFKAWSWQRPWQILTRKQVPVTGTTVSLYTQNKTGQWVLWPATLYNQFNPVITNGDGKFAFIVPPGNYYLEASHPDYASYRSETFVVKNELVAFDIALRSEFGSKQILSITAVFGILLAALLMKFKIFRRT